MKTYKIIISSIIIFSILCFSFYLDSFIGVLNVVVSLGIYTILFYILSIIWRKIRKKETINSGIFIQNFLYSISIFILIISITIFSVTYYFNEISPAKMPQYTISNGKKTVKFQTMIHIASPNFYDYIKKELIDFKKKGGVYFFEGVKSGSKENHEKFNKALGVKFDENLYKNVSKLYGIVNQENENFLNLVNNKDFNIDTGIDEIMAIYDKKTENINQENNIPVDVNKEILELLSELNDRELKIIVYLNQAILNALLGNESILEKMQGMNNEELFEVILGERNKILAKKIISSPYEKIFVTYGKLHFDGVFEILKKDDPNWKIIKTKYFYPIK